MQLRIFASVLLTASFLTTLSAIAQTAQPPECTVRNRTLLYDSNTYSNPLGTAIIEAEAGDTLQLIGTCYGNFVISKSLTIRGRQSGQHAIIGSPTAGVLAVPSNAPGVDLTVKDLTIAGGNSGVTIYYGVLTVVRTLITGNTGTGIANWGNSPVVVEDSVISGNTAVRGAGLYNSLASMTIKNSIVSGNTATGDNGGAIFTRGPLTIENSMVIGNLAAGFGGGIYRSSPFPSALALTDTVISANTAASGGGIYPNSCENVTLNGTVHLTGNNPDDWVGCP